MKDEDKESPQRGDIRTPQSDVQGERSPDDRIRLSKVELMSRYKREEWRADRTEGENIRLGCMLLDAKGLIFELKDKLLKARFKLWLSSILSFIAGIAVASGLMLL